MLTPATERLLRLPKPELHVHLDGSLRPATMLDLANERGVPLPVSTAEELAGHMVVSDAASLEEYLRHFDLTLSIMQDADALERIAYELAADHAAENVLYVEVRFCPILSTVQGLHPDEVLDAALNGLHRAENDFDVQTGLIVCGLRSHESARSEEMAELAIAYSDRGVCGFDIAGAEAGNPVLDHVEAFRRASEAGFPITIHAGEGFGADSIRQALELGRADRIGHGTRLHEDPELLETVRKQGVVLEVCLTSNVQTRVATSYAEHPARRYFDEGISVSLGTDNRLMSGVTLTREYEHARDALGFSWPELVTVARTGLEHAFMPAERRRMMIERFEARVAAID